MAHDFGALAQVAAGAGREMSPVDFVRRALLNGLRRVDRDVAVLVHLRAEVGHVAVAIAEAIEVLARLAAFENSHLAGRWGIELPHHFMQDRRDRRGVHQIGQGRVIHQAFTLLGGLDPPARRLNQVRRDRATDDEVTVPMEGPLLFKRQAGICANLRY